MSRRLIALGVSALILAALWWRVDPAAIWSAVGAADPGWLVAGLAAVIPLTMVTAWRFQLLSRGALGTASTVRLMLSSSTLNLVLPSKLGDLAKAWVLTRRHGFGGEMALAIVVLEKLLDMASLLVWGVVALLWIAGGRIELLLAAAAVGGLLLLVIVLLLPLPFAAALIARIGGLLPGKPARMLTGFADEWRAVLQWFWGERARATLVVLVSLAAWAMHLTQFWLFARALDASVPLIHNMAYATLSILVGLAPFTIAGIGTRDVAIVFFYGPWLHAGQGAVLGLLATTRYLLPAIAGLPFMGDYVDAARPVKVQAPEGQEPVQRRP